MSFSFITLLEDGINRALRLDPETQARLAELQGKAIRLRAAGDPAFEIFILPDESGLRLRARHEREPDVTLTGDIPVILRFAARRVLPDVVAAGEVQISGDIGLGQRFQRLMEQVDIDWEEQAARVLGDVAAHRLGNAVRDVSGWSRQAWGTLRQDLAEYLQEESRLLPHHAAAAGFRGSVEALRRDLENLEQRLARLRETAK